MGHNHGSNADEGTLTNLQIVAQADAWRNVGVISNAIVVVHGAASVQDDVGANHAARVDHNTSANHRIRANAYIGRNHRGWLLCDGQALALLLQLIKQTVAGTIITNRDNQAVMGDVGMYPQSP